MPASFRSSISGVLFLAATSELLVLAVVLITGGFTLAVGPLRISAHRLSGPLLIASFCLGAAALLDRAALRAAASALALRIDRYAGAIALCLAAGALGAGVGLGTYSAAGADAAGYLSQARLVASGSITVDQDLARRVSWPEATWTFSPLGYRPASSPGELAPTYPPGLPATMALAAEVAGDTAAFLVVPLLGALGVGATFALGARLHSRHAGLAAATLLATSPVFLFQVVQPMSDVAATAWWAAAFALALTGGRIALAAAGVAAGLALLTRPNLFPLLLPLALVAAGWTMRPTLIGTARRIGPMAAVLVPFAAYLVWLQWRLYGGATESGYGRLRDLFSLSAIGANALGYGSRLLWGETAALALCAAAAIVLAVRRRAEDGSGAASLMPSLRLGGAVALCALACYLPYAVFTEWSYLRFFLPILPMAYVAAGALVASAMTRLPAPARGVALLLALVSAGSANVKIASREQAFNLRRYEAHYRDAGLYLASALPANAVVFALQQSASAFYYTGRPIVRWDLLRTDLDQAVADVQALRRVPVLLVEDREAEDLRRRFPQSALARLDWQPRADMGTHTHVRLYDPRDRNAAAPFVTDRVR